MIKKIIFANWKMNGNEKDLINLSLFIKEIHNKKYNLVIFPPSLYIYPIKKIFCNTPNIHIGAQNCSKFDNGSYTGDISSKMIKEYCNYVIVGHSERRIFYQENDQDILEKIQKLLKYNLNIIYCIGEKIFDSSYSYILKQIDIILNIYKMHYKNITIAYEPIFKIGGKNAMSTTNIKNIINMIKKYINKKTNIEIYDIKCIYGGSVNKKNFFDIININGISGVLIGNASLDFHNIKYIIGK